MKIILNNAIELLAKEVPQRLLATVKADLTLNNPKYLQAIKLGKKPWGVEKHIHLWRYEGDRLILPRGYAKALGGHCRRMGINFQWQDNRLVLPTVEFNSMITLRSYQIPAVEALVKGQQGGLVAGCGAGKTQTLLEAIARIGQPSLVICHSHELLNQWVERAASTLSIPVEEIGRIAEGKVSIGKRLTVALVQTLSRIDLSEITPCFGLIAIDEAHRLAAPSFFHPVGQFPAKYRFWTSATPERQDGLGKMVLAAGGQVLHTIERCELQTITPRLKVVETAFMSQESEYVKLIGEIVQDNARNELIVDSIAEEAPGHYSLVLSERKEHLYTIENMAKEKIPGLRTAILTGDLSKKERKLIMDRALNKEMDILFATQLAREGLDLPHLDRLFLLCPKRALGATEQEVGRIMRTAPSKQDAMVIDFADMLHPITRSQYWARLPVYVKLKMCQPPKWLKNKAIQAM